MIRDPHYPEERTLSSHHRQARLHAYVKAHGTLDLAHSWQKHRAHPDFGHTIESIFHHVYTNADAGWAAIVHDHYHHGNANLDEVQPRNSPDEITCVHLRGEEEHAYFTYNVYEPDEDDGDYDDDDCDDDDCDDETQD